MAMDLLSDVKSSAENRGRRMDHAFFYGLSARYRVLNRKHPIIQNRGFPYYTRLRTATRSL
jgi:hypothetical protein